MEGVGKDRKRASGRMNGPVGQGRVSREYADARFRRRCQPIAIEWRAHGSAISPQAARRRPQGRQTLRHLL